MSATYLTDLAVTQYIPTKTFRAANGVNAIRTGNLWKYTAGVPTVLAQHDKQMRVYVCLENADATTNTTTNGDHPGFLAVPFADAMVTMQYTGGTPVIGTDYAVNDYQTVDVADTANKLVTVVDVNTTLGVCKVIEYKLAS